MQPEDRLIELRHGQSPDITWLKDTYEQTIRDLGDWATQAKHNYNTRYAEWNGRKENQRKGPGELPYEGAADLRQFIADDYCNKDVALMVTALFNSNLIAIPVEGGDVEQSQLVSVFMKWLLFSQMDELQREAAVLANYVVEKGYGALGIFWKTEEAISLEEHSIEQIQERLPEHADFINLLNGAEDENISDIAEILKTIYPSLKKPKLKKLVKQLRDDGVAEFPVKRIVKNRPCVRAYTIDEDFAFPINTVGSIQNAPYVFCADYYSPEALMGEAQANGWSEEVAKKIIETSARNSPHEYYRNPINTVHTNAYTSDTNRTLIKIVCCYYKGIDEDGVPGTFYTIFHPDVEEHLHHTLLDYKPSRYPFVDFPREILTTRVLDSRGAPEIIKGSQDEIKHQRDCRMDRTAFATFPTLEVPLGKRIENLGPATQVETLRSGQYKYMDIPRYDIGSKEIEETLFESLDRYFGKSTERPEESRLIMQQAVKTWLMGWKFATRHIWQLYRQYGPDIEYFRVIGASEQQMQQFSKDNVPEKYDMYLTFDTLSLDREQHLKTLETIGTVLSTHDRTGQADFGKFLKLFLNAINPTYADEIIMPADQAIEKEVETTQSDLAKIYSGQLVNMPENVNIQLRDQVINQYLSQPDVLQRYNSDEAFKQRVDAYYQQLEQKAAQQENAITGRGQTPGAGPPSSS